MVIFNNNYFYKYYYIIDLIIYPTSISYTTLKYTYLAKSSFSVITNQQSEGIT